MSDRSRRRFLAEWAALIGTALVSVLVPLTPGRESIAGLSVDSITLTVPIAILATLPLIRQLGRAGMPRVGIEVPALLFLGWALLSAIATGAQVGVIATWVRYVFYILLVYVVAVVTSDERHRRLLIWATAIAGSVTVIQGFVQYVTPGAGIGMQGLDNSVATRVFATFDNPNFYAEFLVLLFAVTLALLFMERGLLRYVAAVLLAAQAIALLLTYTRGSWLALALGMVVALLMIDVRLIWPFAAGGVVILPIVPGAMSRLLSAFSLEGTTSFRLRLWQIAGIAIEKRPAFGIGLGRFYDAFKDAVLSTPGIVIGQLIYGAHNSYFQLGAEIGIPGMLAFAWFVFEACRMGAFYNRRMGTDLRGRLVNAALTSGIIAFAVNAMTSNAFQHPRGAVFFFVLVGIQAGVGSRYWTAQPTGATHRYRDRTLWSGSVVGRSLRALSTTLGDYWRSSATCRVMTGVPLGSGDILVSSPMVAGIVFDRSEGDPRVDTGGSPRA